MSYPTGFADQHIFGQWSIVSPDLAPRETPLIVTFADADGVFFTLNPAGARLPFDIWSLVAGHELTVLVAAAAIVVGLAVVFLRPQRGTAPVGRPAGAGAPVRAIAIGYGADRPYSLGAGDPRDVAQVLMYASGRMRLVRRAADEPISVNGAAVAEEAWITAADTVRIGAKQFRFT